MANELIVELTGESRVTQVQPPWGAWVNFFQFDPDAPAPITLRSEKSGERIERPIVRHDHNWTVEIPGRHAAVRQSSVSVARGRTASRTGSTRTESPTSRSGARHDIPAQACCSPEIFAINCRTRGGRHPPAEQAWPKTRSSRSERSPTTSS